MLSLDFYLACILGGSLSTGLTHAGVTPLDLIKCNMQANPTKYSSMGFVLKRVVRRHGAGVLFKGWLPTFLGYSAQGAVKFGLYELFKEVLRGMVGNCSNSNNSEEEIKEKNSSVLVSMVGSAAAELIADVVLCPFEAIKVRVQTHPDLSIAFSQAAMELVGSEGLSGLFKGLLPLWGRQIPYTMVKFACFEKTVDGIYNHIVCTPKEDCPRGVQLAVSFLAGYISGISCALVSHPADNLVSIINNNSGESLSSALKKIGLISLFTKGLWLRVLMVGTMSGAQWGIYDAVKAIARKSKNGVDQATGSRLHEDFNSTKMSSSKELIQLRPAS